ncbi:F0F1 ATP synthase subunit delta [Marinicella gelatinilytica]|uniref:F0F1 ATP synthase subunit delta n=1 Tax=Marinicella gelatinilytica TaxID=2996017 RepID=UPI002260CF0E|nr:F0F1 ATP synthase subunit delta [Marinicella gelatinilytica]MCX7546142.1 F0F1 ATP synthase subunit delta [Marinicella gelatinilytica]
MSELITLARPYAKAAYEFAKSVDKVADWQKQLAVAAGMAEHDVAAAIFSDPDVTDAQLVTLIAGDDSDEHYQNFIKLMIENDRLSLLPDVAQLYQYYYEQDSGAQTVDVYAAAPLSDDQQQRLVEALSRRTGKDISLHIEVDETLLGGAKIYCGDLVIDGTLSGKIERLKTELFN